jgi:CIC family chloride channel protein
VLVKGSSSKIAAFFCLAFTGTIVSIFILNYCDLFYDLGIIAKDRLIENPLLAFFITPVMFWISAFTCRRFAQNAAGSTLDHVKSALITLEKDPNSFEKISTFLNLKIVIVNCISSLVSTYGGGALGCEAPAVHMSVSIFAVIASKLKSIIPAITLEAWIYAGSASGLAIAFNAPIAAFIYIVEKLIIAKSRRNFISNICWSAAALFVAIVILHKTDPLFATYPIDFEISFQLVMVALLAMICGMTAFLLKKIAILAYAKFAKIEGNLWHLIPIIMGFGVSIVSLYAGIYSFSGGIKIAQDILSNVEPAIGTKEVFGRLANTILTFASGSAGGLVAPAVAIGANIGSAVALVANTLSTKIFILGGMAAFLSPILSVPFAAAMVILETTDQSLMAFPFLIFSSLISYVVEKLTDKFAE